MYIYICHKIFYKCFIKLPQLLPINLFKKILSGTLYLFDFFVRCFVVKLVMLIFSLNRFELLRLTGLYSFVVNQEEVLMTL